MMFKFLIGLFFLPVMGEAQSGGVKFWQFSNWNEVVRKAQKDNKYIFVDYYATWCGPCKWMDKEVFGKDDVGQFFDKNFVAIKVQLDTAKNDNKFIKSWYQQAKLMRTRYSVNSIPTYLFFSPEGKPVHRYHGAVTDSGFVDVAMAALDPEKQYYSLLDNYHHGKYNVRTLIYLARYARLLGDRKQADAIARKCIAELNKTDEVNLLKREHVQFVTEFAEQLNSSDKYFELSYHHPLKMDSVINRKGVGAGIADNVITREEIKPQLKIPGATDPDWLNIKQGIERKYGDEYAERNLINAQVDWFWRKERWHELINCYIIRADKFGVDTTGLEKTFLNNFIFEVIFMHSDDVLQLNRGLDWMEMLLKLQPDDAAAIDTYANLLYKIGRVTAAIALEENALKLETESAKNQGRDPDPAYMQTLLKMRNGTPTWLEKKD